MIHPIVFLIAFPLLPAILLPFIPSRRIQGWLVYASSALIFVGVAHLASFAGPGETVLALPASLERLLSFGEAALGLAFLFLCRRLPLRRVWIPALIAVLYGITLFWGFSGRLPSVERTFRVDNLSIIMALLAGVVGTLIAVYAVSYLDHYHRRHPEVPDRRGRFLAVIFLFFSSFFGVVFSNSLAWLALFWEITTLCSFLLISYPRTREASESAFRALGFLMIGGLALTLAIVDLSERCGTIELARLAALDHRRALLPVLLLALAGMTKAAQFPFAGWLLGAMVAPAPASALLHSSTLVKAGVYLVIRCSPVLRGTVSGALIALIGGLSFLAASAAAVSQSDAKKVLAYSTIANLGLIVLCAGVGTSQALWAASMLIVFHAAAKALLFLGVGTVEQQIGSRDLEEMRGLISRLPRLTLIILAGMAGMFLAPFGMLISKWAVLETLARRSPVFPVVVIFGGALTFFFWGKWMAELVAVDESSERAEKGIGREWIPLCGLALVNLAACALFPLLGSWLIEPIFGVDPTFTHRVYLMVGTMLALMLLLPLGFLFHWKRLVRAEPYLGGANVPSSRLFRGADGEERPWRVSIYYLNEFFGEKKIIPPAVVAAIVFLVLLFMQATT